MIYYTLLFFVTLIVSACDEDTSETSPAPPSPVQKLSKDLHQFTISPSPVEKPPVEDVSEVEVDLEAITLPSTTPLVREQRARSLRGQRHHGALQKRLLPLEPLQNPILNQEEDYSSLGLSQDLSTYPVDRSRMITADMRLSAVLEDTINSQIPGRAIAVLDRDVFSANGRFILLPAYTKIICQYKNLEKQGQTRLALKCTRLIGPHGVSLLLTNSQTADQMGRNGLIGDMDYRFWQRYGAAFLISGLSALSQAGSGLTKSRAVDEGVTNLSHNLTHLTGQFLEEAVDVKPVITIAAGSRIQIIPQTDIVLKKLNNPPEKASS